MQVTCAIRSRLRGPLIILVIATWRCSSAKDGCGSPRTPSCARWLQIGCAGRDDRRAVRARGGRLWRPWHVHEPASARASSMSIPAPAAHAEPAEAALSITPGAFARLLRLASPMLPVGAYSYSQGLEWRWSLVGPRCGKRANLDRGRAAFPHGANRGAAVVAFVPRLARGRSRRRPALERLLSRCPRNRGAPRRDRSDGPFPATSAGRAWRIQRSGRTASTRSRSRPFRRRSRSPLLRWRIPPAAALLAYVWSWVENQVLAAMKSVPLGQIAGQQLLTALMPACKARWRQPRRTEDEAISNFAPGLALASSLHETQYSRLFRS